jgi:hypothetical protein
MAAWNKKCVLDGFFYREKINMNNSTCIWVVSCLVERGRTPFSLKLNRILFLQYKKSIFQNFGPKTLKRLMLL